jgi:hypothetical protein
MKTLDIIIKPGTALQGEGPEFKHLESPNREVHTVGEAFGWELVIQKRAQLADPTQLPPGARAEDHEDVAAPGVGVGGVRLRNRGR